MPWGDFYLYWYNLVAHVMSFEAEVCRLRKDVHTFATVLTVIPLTCREIIALHSISR